MADFKTQNKSKFAKVDSLYLMHLVGNDFKRANDHGSLLKGTIINGALKSLVNLVDNKFNPVIKSEKNIFAKNSLILFKTLLKKYFLKMPKISCENQNEILGLSQALGIDENVIKNGIVGPDTITVLGAIGSKYKLAGKTKFPTFGCTTFAIFNPCDNKKLVVGRNLDYPSSGLFEKYPLVTFHEPDDGGQKYITFSSLGIHTAGLTSINESGLFFAINQNFTRSINIFGSPSIALLNDVVKKSKTLEEAVNELKSKKFIAGWTITIVDLKNGKGTICEITGKSFSTRSEESCILLATNNYQGISRLQEYYPNYSHHLSSKFRYQRATDILKENINNFDNINPITLLADRNTTANKSFIGALGGTHNIQTVYVDTRDDSIYVSISDTSPTAFGNFAKFNLYDFFKIDFSLEKFREKIKIIKQGVTSNSEKVFRGVYRQSYLDYETGDFESSLNNLTDATKRDADNFHYPFLAALVAFALGKIEFSSENLKIAENRNSTLHQRSLIYLFKGRINDVKKERSEALQNYGLAFEYAVCPKIKKEILNGVKKPYDISKRNRILIDFMYGDLHAL